MYVSCYRVSYKSIRHALAALLLSGAISACGGGGGGSSADGSSSAPAPAPEDPSFAVQAIPEVTITVEGGAAFTTATSVSVALSFINNPTDQYITQTAGCTAGGTWVRKKANNSWTLLYTNAVNTIYVKVRNASGESACVSASITHDDRAPTVTSIVLNGGVAMTNAATANVDSVVSADATEMYITKASNCNNGGAWEPYSASKVWTLPNLNATNTAYIKIRDGAGNEGACTGSNTITHDDTPPTASSVNINAGAAYTNSTAATLTLAAAGTPSEMYITGTAGCGSGGSWVAFAASAAYTLTANATNNVYFKVRDAASNESTCITDSIIHDDLPPAANSILIDGGAAYTSTTAVTLTLSATDATEMYVTQTASCTAGGVWEAYNVSKAWTLANSNAPNTVYVKFRDAATNESSCISANITHSNTPPVAQSIAIAGGAAYTNSTSVTLTLSATNNPAEMYITETAGCTAGGAWEAYNTSKAWTLSTTDAVNTVYVKFRGGTGLESSCISDTIDHEPAPTVDITSPVIGTFIFSGNVAAFTVGGSCFPSGQTVNISGDATSSALCSGGAWSATLDLSALLEGTVTLNADLSNTYGQNATQATRAFTKDTSRPFAGPWDSVTIAGSMGADGILYTNSTSVTLNINATEAAEMYITDTAGCASGGAWETYAATKAWTLSGSNGTIWVYGKFRDVAGNTTDCAAGRIAHDDTPATFTVDAPLDGAGVTGANQAAFSMSGTCSDDGKKIYINNGITAAATCTAGAWSKDFNLTSMADGNVTLDFTFSDDRGHWATPISRTVTKDTVLPTLTYTVPANGGFVNLSNQSNFAIGGTCSEEGQNVDVLTPVAASAVCTGGTWSTTADMTSVPDGNATLTAVHYDSSGNTSLTVSRAIKIDTALPTVAITSPAADGDLIYSGNQSYILMSGTCSVSGRPVTISGAATGSVTCNSGTWLLALDFSGAGEGAISVTATHGDAGGNTATATRGFTKDALAPSGTSITIDGGTAATTSTEVVLTLAATDATEMYVTRASNCIGYGAWEPYSASKNWTLSSINRNVVVAVKYRDSNGNESACVTDDIIHDTLAPTWSSSPTHALYNSSLTSSPAVTYTEDAVDSLSGINKYQFAVGSGVTGGLMNNVKDWTDVADGSFTATGLTLTAGSRYFVNMKAIDNMGNEVTRYSSGWTVDIVAPNITVTTHIEGETVNEDDQRIAGRCEALAGDVNISYSAGVTGPATAACVGNNYYFFAEFSGAGGARSVTLAQTDSSGNAASLTLNLTYAVRTEIKGQIYAMAQAADGSKFYGGAISSYTSSKTGGLVRVSSSGAKDSGFDVKSGFNGNIFAVVELSDGSLVFGGDFTRFRGRTALRIAKINASGELDLNFSPQTGFNGANGVVYGLATDGTNIYAAGAFSQIKGKLAYRIAKLDSDSNVDLTFNPQAGANGAGAIVRAVALNGNALYIAGDFTTYQGAAATRIAKVDATTGALDTGFSSAGPDKSVNALLYSGGALYLGGSFANYGAAPANGIAKVDAAAGTLDTTFNPGSGSNGFTSYGPIVYALADLGGDIVAGGAFTAYRGTAANNIAKISPTGALDTTFSPSSGANGFNGQVLSLHANGSVVYAGGSFTSYRGDLVRHVAKLTTAGALDTLFSPSSGADSAGIDGAVTAILTSGSQVYLAGSFTSYRNSYVVHGLLKTDAAGTIDTNFNLQSGADGFNGDVRSIEVGTGVIYVGGSFTTYRGQPANGIAKLDLDGNLDTAFNPPSGANGVNGTVLAIELEGNDLYIGGAFTQYHGSLANRIAKVDATTGALDTTFSPASGANGTNNSVHALKVDGTTLWVGGAFSAYRAQPAGRLAKVSTADGSLDLTFNPAAGANGVNATVYSILLNGTDIYIGGVFTLFRGVTANRVAKFSSTTYDLDTTFTSGAGFNGGVQAMVLQGGSLYLGGDFLLYRGALAYRVAKIDATSGVLDTVFSPAANNGLTGLQLANPKLTPQATALLHDGTNLTVGGVFSRYRNRLYNFSVVVDSTGAIVP